MADPVSAATTLADIVVEVYKQYAAVGEQIDSWARSESRLAALQIKVTALQRAASTLKSQELEAQTNNLHDKLKAALAAVEKLHKQRQASNFLTRLCSWCSTKAAVDQAKTALEDVVGASDDFIKVADTLLRIHGNNTIASVANNVEGLRGDAMTIHRANLMAKVEEDYKPYIKFMEVLVEQQKAMGGQYPDLAFTDPDRAATRDRMLHGMKGLWSVWKQVQGGIKDKVLDEAWFQENRNWLHRGRQYRLLVEPLDIFNWYHKGKHLDGKSGHYIDGITPDNELTFDNNKRPGRYLLLQQMEQQVLQQTPVSSLGKARQLKQRLGDEKPLTSLYDKPMASLQGQAPDQMVHLQGNYQEADLAY